MTVIQLQLLERRLVNCNCALILHIEHNVPKRYVFHSSDLVLKFISKLAVSNGRI